MRANLRARSVNLSLRAPPNVRALVQNSPSSTRQIAVARGQRWEPSYCQRACARSGARTDVSTGCGSKSTKFLRRGWGKRKSSRTYC